jgi:hypothetical protein
VYRRCEEGKPLAIAADADDWRQDGLIGRTWLRDKLLAILLIANSW